MLTGNEDSRERSYKSTGKPLPEQRNYADLGNTVKEKLSIVKMLVLDVDGTLTDGSMYYSPEGEQLKRFFVRDGMGIVLLQRAGIETAILTTENTRIVAKRAEKLGIRHLVMGSRNKKRSMIELSESAGISFANMAYMGDDVNDEFGIRQAGVSACPSDATELIRSMVDIISNYPGGRGAVREFAEFILRAQDKSLSLPEEW
jgi:3-deoxy-D-manno-octulosonate 8-phosphate phosphatase (KDO 8-P phosphatase)